MRSIESLLSAVSMILANPSAERGYEELAHAYDACGMKEDAEAVRFLISEKFRADSTGSHQEQH